MVAFQCGNQLPGTQDKEDESSSYSSVTLQLWIWNLNIFSFMDPVNYRCDGLSQQSLQRVIHTLLSAQVEDCCVVSTYEHHISYELSICISPPGFYSIPPLPTTHFPSLSSIFL